jgi:hypothetical protein
MARSRRLRRRMSGELTRQSRSEFQSDSSPRRPWSRSPSPSANFAPLIAPTEVPR